MRAVFMGVLVCFAIGTPAGLNAQTSLATLQEEAAVYQALVDLWRTQSDSQPGPMLVATVTAPGWALPHSRTTLAFLVRAYSTSEHLEADFLRRNATATTLQLERGAPGTVRWLERIAPPSDASDSAYSAGWERVHEQWPDAAAIMQLSRAAFTSDMDSALVIQESLARPPHGIAGCRDNVLTYLLTKVDGDWQVDVVGLVSHYRRAVVERTAAES